MELFKENINDNGFAVILKREANLVLASLPEEEQLRKKELFEDAIAVAKTFTSIETEEETVPFVLDTLSKLWNIGILSPLTLNDDEFNEEGYNGKRHNKRYYHIYVDMVDKEICNNKAFNVKVRALYNHNSLEQVAAKYLPKLVENNRKVYISKGGVITGEYFKKAIIRQEIVNKHCFTIQSVVNIPVCSICYINKDTNSPDIIYVMDHREPKFKALQEFYDIPIHTDNHIKDYKFNIRKYKKLIK